MNPPKQKKTKEQDPVLIGTPSHNFLSEIG